jgi:RNA-directed DNA polymerase
MHNAWTRVKKNTGAAGVDGMSIDEMPEYLREHWIGIRESLMEDTYQPLPVRRKEIPKPSGGPRKLGVPTVLDRLIQQAIAQVLTEICDPDFSEFSDGFRPGRSAHDAVDKAREYLRQTDTIAVDMDLAKFFDTVNHDVLMCRVSRKIQDTRVLQLMGRRKACRKGGRCRPFWRISCSMSWTRNWNSEGIASSATRTMSSSV